MRFDLLRLRRKLCGRSFVMGLRTFSIEVMNGHVRVRNRRLLQIIIHAAAAARVAALQLDGDARAAIEFRHPFDAVVRNVLRTFLTGWDVFTFAFAIDDFRLVALRVDLNLEIMRGFFRRYLGDDLHRFTRREHAVHSCGADADALLAAAHAQAMEFGSVKQFAEDQWNLLLDDTGTIVLHADLEPIWGSRFDMNPDFGYDAAFLAGI